VGRRSEKRREVRRGVRERWSGGKEKARRRMRKSRRK
jgi:hypothetical protein